MRGEYNMSIVREILNKFNEYDAVNNAFMNTDELSDAEENNLIDKIDKITDEAVDLIIKFVPSIDKKTAYRMFRFHGDKVKSILLKGCRYE